MLCQATRTETATQVVPTGSGGAEFFVCASSAKKLLSYSLTPLEWLNLVAQHGRLSPFLDDDFYDLRGRALQPRARVMVESHQVFPALHEIRSDLERIVDVAIAWGPNQCARLGLDVMALFAKWDSSTVMSSLMRRCEQVVAPDVVEALYLMAALVVDRRWAEWVASRWQGGMSTKERLWSLTRLSIRALKFDEVYQLFWREWSLLSPAERQYAELAAASMIEGAPTDNRESIATSIVETFPIGTRGAVACRIMATISSSQLLNWIEKQVPIDGVSYWGQLASICQVRWPELSAWLDRGRPLSLVALDCLYTCAGCEPSRIVPTVKERGPAIAGKLTREVVVDAISRYAEADPSPRVRSQVAAICSLEGGGLWDRR